MVFRNLLRRRGRTILTILGIAVGVAAIIGLGAMADGFSKGYSSMVSGARADLVLSQPNTYDITFSSVDENVKEDLLGFPEVDKAAGMLQGLVATDNSPYFFIFGHDETGFVAQRFKINQGIALDDPEIQRIHGKPLLLGESAAEAEKKKVGDTLRVSGSVFRIVGIYRTGDAFEDGGAVIRLKDAQSLLGKQRQVSMYYLRLKESADREKLTERVTRRWKQYSLTGTSEFTNKQSMVEMLNAFVWVIAGLAIILGGVSMMNAQLMAVFERTREIGVLRAVGWSSGRVLRLILGESLVVCLLGGLLGVGIGLLCLQVFSSALSFIGASATTVRPGLIAQAFGVVLVLGLVGGLYPAWLASRLQPIEALRYEGGSGGGKVHRLPVGGMAVQSLWQRSTRTGLTLLVIGLTVGAIISLEAVIRGTAQSLNGLALGADSQILGRQADISDTSMSAVDERYIQKIAVLPGVEYVSGMVFAASMLPESNTMFVLQGYAPGEYAMTRFNVVRGKAVDSNRQVMIGSAIAKAAKKDVGDSIELNGVRFRIVGVYESGVGWEEMGGVISLRDAQTITGRPRKVTMISVKVKDPAQAPAIVDEINRQMPEVSAALTADFAEQMPDMKNSRGMMNGISFLAILVGGLGVMNTMLMAVLERTREIGVLRALGWRAQAVLGMIMQEALVLGLLGGVAGIGVAFAMVFLMQASPDFGGMIEVIWEWDIFVRALVVAALLGLVGGLYPAYRATRLQPVEALRYE